MTDKNIEEDAGIDEGYGEPKEKVQLAGVALRKPCFCQQAKTDDLLYPVSKCVSSSQPVQLCLHCREPAGDPTHDKVRRRKPDKVDQVFRDSEKLPPALTLKMISVFLMLASIDYSLISVTQAEGIP